MLSKVKKDMNGYREKLKMEISGEIMSLETCFWAVSFDDDIWDQYNIISDMIQ